MFVISVLTPLVQVVPCPDVKTQTTPWDKSEGIIDRKQQAEVARGGWTAGKLPTISFVPC